MLQGLVHSSGGIGWHLRALRYRNPLWAPFRQALRDWLEAWQPEPDRLLLVGPSAAHTLPVDLLQTRFRDITALEPDPLARLWLRLRLPSVRFAQPIPLDEAGIAGLARDHSGATILFCNVLGQLSPPPMGWSAALTPLQGHDWASFHDLFSTTRPADRARPTGASESGPQAGLEQIAAHYWRGGVLELTDHQTLDLGDPSSRRHALWRLTPRHWHVVGWSWHMGIRTERTGPSRQDEGCSAGLTDVSCM